MNPRQQLEELTAWTKQAGHWLNENQPRLARVTDPVMARSSAHLGYLMTAHEFVEATQAPPIVQAALYSAAGVGMYKWNEIVVKEINQALNEYNARQTSGSEFGWAKSLLLAGTASLAISTAAGNSDSQGTMFSGEKVESVEKSLVQEPVDETYTEVILEPTEENTLTETNLPNLDFNQTKIDLTDIIENNLRPINLEDIENLTAELEETFARISLLEQKLHPRAQAHYNIISQGYEKKMTIRKFERLREHDDLIKKYAEEENVPYTMMFALIINESAGDKRAKSYAGARGLMQVMPRTAKWFQEKVLNERFSNSALYDPEKNIRLGAKYLAFLHKRVTGMLGDEERFGLDEAELWDITMACYNRGYSGMMKVIANDRRVAKATLKEKETGIPAYSFWSLRKGETTDEAFRYVSKIDGIDRLYNEYLQEKAGITDEVAKMVH
jgi:hypothetical protein